MPLDIDSIVRVTAQIAPAGGLHREFGRTLFVYPATDSGSPDPQHLRVNPYTALDGVTGDYAATHDAAIAAGIYFQQRPYPRDFLATGWFEAGSATYLAGVVRSGPPPLATIKGLADSTLTVAGNSLAVPLGVTGTGTTGYDAVAAVLETAVQTISNPDLSAATVTYANSAFLVTLPSGGDLGGQFSGPASDALGLGDGSTYIRGVASETIAEALARIQSLDDSWYWLTVASSISVDPTDAAAAAAWAEANDVQLILDNTQIGVLTPNETASIPATVSALEYERTAVLWSRTGDYKAVSLAARFSSVDFDAANSLITGKFVSLPGTTPDDLTVAEKAELDRKRVNHYSVFGGAAIVTEGTTLNPGGFIDVRVWLDWIVGRIQADVLSVLRAQPGRVSQTRIGLAVIQDTVERVCEVGRRNGGLAPGFVSEPLANDIRLATGNNDFDGFLTRGYLINAGLISEQTQSQREDRAAPLFRVWLKGSGAIHFASVDLTFQG